MSSPAVQTLCAALAESGHAVSIGPELEELVDADLACARAQRPALAELPFDDFLRQLAIRLAREPQPLEVLRSLVLADLYLAWACVQANPAALALFDREYQPRISAAIARIGPDLAFVEEVRQRVREKLMVNRPNRPARLSQYSGEGALAVWVRAVAVRTALNARRGAGSSEPLEEGVSSRLSDSRQDLELAFIRREHQSAFKAAFAEAVAQLEPRDRTLLRLHVCDGLSIDHLGALFGAHRSTAARRLTRIHQELLKHLKRALERRLKLSRHGLHSLLGLVRSNIELSLDRLLEAGAERSA